MVECPSEVPSMGAIPCSVLSDGVPLVDPESDVSANDVTIIVDIEENAEERTISGTEYPRKLCLQIGIGWSNHVH